jgi:translation initiation factor IF-2
MSANENKVTFENIKMLSSGQSDISELVKNIREAKRQIDTIIKELKDKEAEFKEKAEKEAQKEAEKTASQSMSVTETPPSSSVIEIEKEISQVPNPEILVSQKAEEIPFPAEKAVADTAPDLTFKAEQPIPAEEPVKEAAPKIESAPVVNAPSAAAAVSEQKQQPKPKKGKTAEEKFLESLPKPVNQENKRIINLIPEKKEKPKNENIQRYTNPDQSSRPSRSRPVAASGGTAGRPYAGGPSSATKDRPKDSDKFKRPFVSGGFTAPAIVPTSASNFKGVKKKTEKNYEVDKKDKVMNKRTLIRRGFETDITLIGDDEYKMGSKKFKVKKKDTQKAVVMPKIEKATVNTDIIPIKTLSEKLGITAVEITKRLFKDGIIKTINETIDYETAALMAADLGIELELKLDKTAEDTLADLQKIDSVSEAGMVKRPPVVTVMGHVDHGKTTLLDTIRHTNVAAGEAGGITQQIGAYTIKAKGEMITFIDTPGHEAFTAMRARGAGVTDIAVLVVAADDGIMPQTVEAINHAKAANVPIIVAINKMDKPNANPERIKQQLTEYGLVSEEWGGDTIICPISAIKGEGIDHLLEMILLVAEVKELKANPDRKAKGTIIEAKLDKGKGPVATVLIQNGTLRVGDMVVAGTVSGKIRAMIDDKGRNVKEAGPSYAISVLGFSEVPGAGDPVFAVEDEKLTKLVAEERLNKIKTDMAKTAAKITLDDVFDKIAQGQIKGLNIIIKGDLLGSVEAVSQALEKLSNDEAKVSIIHSGVGAINESDVTLAQTASAIIIGFNVRPEIKAKQLAERENVDIRLYRIIYDVIDDVKKALKGMLAPKFKEVQTGRAEVRNVFKITGVGTVAGCYVTNGKILRASKVRLLRDNVVITEGNISSLKRFKDDVKEVASGYECGISIENYNDIKENDIIECFHDEEVKE